MKLVPLFRPMGLGPVIALTTGACTTANKAKYVKNMFLTSIKSTISEAR